MFKQPFVSALAALAFTACAVGPDYHKPDMKLPGLWALSPSEQTAPGLSKTWWESFHDPVLSKMIEEAMAANDDVALAAARVAEARANLHYANANRLPEIDLNGSATRQKISQASYGSGANTIATAASGAAAASGKKSAIPTIINDYSITGVLSFDLDLWGRLRRADEAARAQLLASEAGRETVRLAVTTDVASGYFNLLAIDRQIDLTVETIKTRQQSLDLFQKRLDAGTVSALDLRQAESELATAQEQLPILVQQQTEQENALSILLGKSPKEIIETVPTRDRTIEALPVPNDVPALLPSELLEHRPDIRSAERQLVAANAEIGVAKANYFPQLSLNGLLGLSSLQVDDLFKKSAEEWSIGAGVAGPLLDFGRTSADVDAATARKNEALANYQKTVRMAFGEVINTLADQENSEARLEAAHHRVDSLTEYLRLAQLRYDAGYSDYLDVLDAQRGLFSAQLDFIDAERIRLNAVLTLYKALGGGWDDVSAKITKTSS